MDTLAHGLWGGMLAGWKRRFGLAFLFGISPDLLTFGLLIAIRTISGTFEPGKPDPQAIPRWVYINYDITHSLVIMGAVWLLLWWLARGVAVPFSAWLIHIVLDIPTHSREFFPTPFLYPLSDYTFDGFSWGQRWFMILNYSLLLLTAIIWIGYRRSRRAKHERGSLTIETRGNQPEESSPEEISSSRSA